MCIVINVLFLGVLCISEHVQYLNIKVYKILKIQQIIDVLTKPSKWKMPTFQKKIKTEYFLFQKRCQPNKDTNNLLKCTLLMYLTKILLMKQNTFKKDINDFRINVCVLVYI